MRGGGESWSEGVAARGTGDKHVKQANYDLNKDAEMIRCIYV